jgi:uncharacterized membrane protein
MSANDLAAVLLIAGMVLLVMSYWRQIAIFVLFVTLTVLCVGMYYIVRQLHL